jgi:hypothetical protein
MLLIPPELHPEILSLFNESYIEGMDSVESATVSGDGTIEAITIDAGSRLVARYSSGNVEIMQLDIATTGTASFAAGKTRNCKTGISCGATCISKGKTCKSKASASQKDKAAKIEKATSKSKKELSDSQKEVKAVEVDAAKKLPKGHPGEKAVADAQKYAARVAGSNDKEYYLSVHNHLAMTDEKKSDFGEKFAVIKEKENKRKKPATPEQQKAREAVVAMAIKFGERAAIERKGGDKAKRESFLTGVLSHLESGDKQREINKQVLKQKPKKAQYGDDRKDSLKHGDIIGTTKSVREAYERTEDNDPDNAWLKGIKKNKK